MDDREVNKMNPAPLIIGGRLITGYILSYNLLKTLRNRKNIKLIKARERRINNIAFFFRDKTNPDDIKTYGKEIDYSRYKNIKYGDAVIRFIRIMRENFPEYVLDNFYHNLNYLKIDEDKYAIFSDGSSFYSSRNNSILLRGENAIYHELLHMASRDKQLSYNDVGFDQKIKKGKSYIETGIGINEGYTEIMNQRYFVPSANAYLTEQFLTRKIEKIIGIKKMEKYYLTASLLDLIKELCKYSGIITAQDLIIDIDIISLCQTRASILKHKESLTEAIDILITTYLEKLKQDYNKGDIKQEGLLSLFDEYVTGFHYNPLNTIYDYEKEKGMSLEEYKNKLLKESNIFETKTIH